MMLPFLGLIWSKHSGAILIVAGTLALTGGMLAVGYWSGHNAGEVDQLKNSVEAYAKREGIDNDTNALARDAVCLKLGGMREQCDELRRLDETAKGQ